ncbi:hypothetical protein ACJMK2_015538 [Sinanodonta woodiana]|uniref:Uncharacterized protein n=1 Tax=Sinanodonta woodiana TaxID=1069815 RepID=A0ABD3USS1_SINWO
MIRYCALVFVVLGTVRGCSPPVGGYVEPTAAQLVSYADYVVIGRVTKILTPDPVMTYNTTYGAQVQITCQYKGGTISKDITIIGAGFIPGLCFAKDLKQNVDYILFLSKRENGYFEQTSKALNTTDIRRFLQVCDLMLRFPSGENADFPSVRCQAPNMSKDCERYNPSVDKNTPVAAPSPPPKTVVHPSDHGENVQMGDKGVAQKGQITTTPSGAETNRFLSFVLIFAIMLQALLFL